MADRERLCVGSSLKAGKGAGQYLYFNIGRTGQLTANTDKAHVECAARAQRDLDWDAHSSPAFRIAGSLLGHDDMSDLHLDADPTKTTPTIRC